MQELKNYQKAYLRVYSTMHKVKITAIRQTVYPDLMAKFENLIEHTCDIKEGQS